MDNVKPNYARRRDLKAVTDAMNQNTENINTLTNAELLVYWFTLTQTGTDNPVQEVLKNTLLDSDLTWVRESAGKYYAILPAYLNLDSVSVLMGGDAVEPGITKCFVQTKGLDKALYIFSCLIEYSQGSGQIIFTGYDELLTNTPFMIHALRNP